MADAKKSKASKKPSTPIKVRDLKPAKNPKGGTAVKAGYNLKPNVKV